MHKFVFVFISLLIALCIFSGCRDNKPAIYFSDVPSRDFSTAPEINIPPKDAVNPNKLPLHVTSAAEALARKIIGCTSSFSQAEFSTDGAHSWLFESLNEQDFQVSSIEIMRYSKDSKDMTVSLEMYMHFQDRMGRTASFLVQADYKRLADKIVIERSDIQEKSPLFPRVQAFILYEEELRSKDLSDMTFKQFYYWTLDRALSLTPDDEHRRTKLNIDRMSVYQRMSMMPEAQTEKYSIVVLTMDRLASNSGFKIEVSGTPHGTNWIEEVTYHDFQGWRAGIFSLSFILDWEIYYVRALYGAKQENWTAKNKLKLVGLFSTERDYTHWPAFDGRTALQGPIARLGIMLEPENADDAGMIASRLHELGFLKNADNKCEEKLEEALKIFQHTRGLNPSGQWSAETQKKLFHDTGL